MSIDIYLEYIKNKTVSIYLFISFLFLIKMNFEKYFSTSDLYQILELEKNATIPEGNIYTGIVTYAAAY